MGKILDAIGYDLTEDVKRNDLRTLSFDSIQVTNSGLSLHKYVLFTLSKSKNSMFLVGDDINQITAYINALALLLDQEKELIEALKLMNWYAHKEIGTSPSFESQSIEKLSGKRLFVIDTIKLTRLGDNNREAWDVAFDNVMSELNQGNYYAVMQNFSPIFTSNVNRLTQYIAHRIFFVTRARVKMTFIAPMLWEQF